MNQLTLGAILNIVNALKEQGMTEKEIKETPIYLGDDDELNGIHTGWYINIVDPNAYEDQNLVTLIEETNCNVPIKRKSILIS